MKYSTVDEYFRKLKMNGLKSNTLLTQFYSLQWYFTKILDRDQLKREFKIGNRTLLPLVEEDELHAMLAAVKRCYKPYAQDKLACEHKSCEYLQERNIMLLKFLYSTGARVSEVSNLLVGDLHETQA